MFKIPLAEKGRKEESQKIKILISPKIIKQIKNYANAITLSLKQVGIKFQVNQRILYNI